MSRTYKIKCYRERKDYVRMNHTKRMHHEMMAALDDPRANHTYDRGRTEGRFRVYWVDFNKGYNKNDDEE